MIIIKVYFAVCVEISDFLIFQTTAIKDIKILQFSFQIIKNFERLA